MSPHGANFSQSTTKIVHEARLLRNAHTGGSSAVTAIYDRNAYLAQKRNALDAWALLLSHIVDSQPLASNVVRISN